MEEIRQEIEREFVPTLNPVLKAEFSNLEFGNRIMFSNVRNIKSDGENKYVFDVTIPNRKYYMRCCYNISKTQPITSVEFLPGIVLYLNATSPDLTYQQLSSRLPFTPTSGWSIGDSFKNGKLSRKFSSVKYSANLNDFTPIEVALKEFVTTLAESANEVKALSRVANVRVIAATWSHISKVDGFVFCKSIFQKMNELGICFDYDPYVYED